MDENNGFTPNENGFQDPTVTPVQPDAAVLADNTAPEQPTNAQPVNTANAPESAQTHPSAQQPTPPAPPTYEQYAAQQAAAQQNGANAQGNGQFNPPPYQQPPVYQNFQPNVQPIPQNNGIATAALVVGIVANVCCGFPAGIVALVLGIIGLNKSKTMCGNGKGMAIAGIILGIISIIWSVAAIVFYTAFGITAIRNYDYSYDYSNDFYSMIRMVLPF